MKHFLKVISFSLLAVIGVMGLALGGMYLFGAFNEKPVYAENLTFNSNEVISANSFGLQVDTNTEDVNQTTLILETSRGGDSIISYPKEIKIGEPFHVSPIKDSSGLNAGGYVELYARYQGSSSNQGCVATCKILVDVPVESVEVSMPAYVVQLNDSILLASAGDTLDSVFDIYPVSSLIPYVSRDVFGSTLSTSKFSSNNLNNKKLFLEVFTTNENPNNSTNSNIVSLVVGTGATAVDNAVVEVEYEYNSSIEKFVFTKDVYVKPGPSRVMGEMCLKAYFCSTYASQSVSTGVSVSNFHDTTLSETAVSFNIIDYTVDDLSLSLSSDEVYLNEDTSFYINNANADDVASAEDRTGINLGITLTNSNSGIIEDSIYRNNIYISVESNINYILTKSNNSNTENNFGLNAYDESNLLKEDLYWKYKLTDFLSYYNYSKSPTQSNKIKINITYNDGVSTEIVKSFYIIPKIHEVTSLDVEYAEPTDTSFYKKSGESFQLTESNFEYSSTSTPTFRTLAYYIPYDANNDISTLPTTFGKYSVEFDFTISSANTISFSLTGSYWGSITSSSALFTQGSRTYSVLFGSTGIQENGSQNAVEFEADKSIHCRIAELNFTPNYVTDSSILFTIIAGSQTIQIKGNESKFTKSDTELPYIVINNISYNIDFEFYKDGEDRYIYIKADTSNYTLQGIGSFNIVAQLVYIDSVTNDIYWLGKSDTVSIYVYTELTSFTVQEYNDATKVASSFQAENIFDESDEVLHYIYVTCNSNQLDALRQYYENNQLKASFSQNYGAITASNYNSGTGISLTDLNTDAVTFGSWMQVTNDNSEVIGYKTYYIINPIYSIVINGVELDNKFDIKVYIDNASVDVLADFIHTNSTKKALSIQIVDKILNSASISYSGSSAGTSAENPLALNAQISNSSLAWSVGGSGSPVTELAGLNYYFSYSTATSEHTIMSMSSSITLENSVELSNISSFYTFDKKSNCSGGLSFKNIPYFEEGVLLRLKIFVVSEDKQTYNSRYEWNSITGEFENKIVPALESGQSFYFLVKGLDIEIVAHDTNSLVGYKDNELQMFGQTEDSIFTFKVGETAVTNVTDYSSFFVATVNNASGNVSVSSSYSTITVNNDFLKDQDMQIGFHYANGTALKIKLGESSTIYNEVYVQNVQSAFEIDHVTSFTAPDTSQSFGTITYPSDESITNVFNAFGASELGLITVTISKLDNSQPFSINTTDLLAFDFKTITGSYDASYRLTLKHNTSLQEAYYDFSAHVTSIYDDSNLIIGTAVGENYQITAGIENAVSMTSNGIVLVGNLLTNKSNITGIAISFANKGTDALSTDDHMVVTEYVNAPVKNIGLYSTDLNYDKEITVTMTFTFLDGGSCVFVKDLSIVGNISITLGEGAYYPVASGDMLNLGDSGLYCVTRIGDSTSPAIPQSDFDEPDNIYTASSFTYDSTYFADVTEEYSSTSPLFLRVRYGEHTEVAIDTTITFNYITEQNYVLTFNFAIKVTLNAVP